VRRFTFDEVDSTNDEGRRLALDGAPHGSLITAKRQTAGRGRRGRHWESLEGNLHLSLILRPEVPLSQAAELGFVAALAIVEALGRLLPNQRFSCKWPNDVLMDGKKVAGLLLETDGERRPAFIILGVGINVAHPPHEARYPAAALVEAGYGGTAESVLELFREVFFTRYAAWVSQGFAPIREGWLTRAHKIGAPMRVDLGQEIIEGEFAGLDGEGALLLSTLLETRRILTGDVLWGGS
jgi:BirA family biotin operon repressor/biotin-[acetyl-CoA-carboxylase] ligase